MIYLYHKNYIHNGLTSIIVISFNKDLEDNC